MWYEIKQGRHRAYPLSLGIHTGKTEESYEVIFDDYCRYVLDSENQEDWNKGGGWSYGLHHQNSVRWVWRYRPETDKLELTLYQYKNKERLIGNRVIEVNLNEKVRLDLYSDRLHVHCLTPNDSVPYVKESKGEYMKPTWGYNLGLFFGGNKTAPHNMKVWLKKL